MIVLVVGFVWIFAELIVLVEVARLIGVLEAVLLVLVLSAFGPWLVRRAGLGVWRRSRARVADGELPGREALDGIILLGAGALICVPGFIGDAVGLLLLVSPVRALVRRFVAGWFWRRLPPEVNGLAGGAPRRGRGPYIDAPTHDAGRRSRSDPDGGSTEPPELPSS